MQLTSSPWVPAILAMGAIALSPLTSMAQAQPGQGRPRFTPEQKLEHIKVMRGKMLREQVGLDEKKATQVESALAAFDADHVKFHQTMRDSKMQLKEVVKNPNADDKAYRAAVTKHRTAFKQLHSLKEREWNRVSTMLTPKQQALLLLSLGKMKHHYGKNCGQGGMCAGAGACADPSDCGCPCSASGGPGMCTGAGKGPGGPGTKPAPGTPGSKPGKRGGPGAGVGPVTGPGPAPSK
jgi:Spy/CpxP family protein refolding chaperone